MPGGGGGGGEQTTRAGSFEVANGFFFGCRLPIFSASPFHDVDVMIFLCSRLVQLEGVVTVIDDVECHLVGGGHAMDPFEMRVLDQVGNVLKTG